MNSEVSPVKSHDASLDPKAYLTRLYEEVMKDEYCPEPDDPHTPTDESRTFCNYFTRAVCKWFGWEGFEGLLAVQMVDVMERISSTGGEWVKLNTYMEATNNALKGRLVVAGVKPPQGVPHGHVCVVAPMGMERSDKWQMDLPVVANVGNHNFCGKKMSFAFPLEWKPRLGLYLYNPGVRTAPVA